MNQFAIVLVLALASTNASKFNRSPGGGFHQEKASREYPEEPFYVNDGIDEEQHLGIFLPKFNSEVENFEPPPKSFTQFRGSRLYDSDEFKMKRSDASLSIVNALDVLRQRIMMEFARRKMNESKAQIQKNRELLMKTGKRSQEESEEPSNYRIPQTLLWKRSQNEDLEKALPVASSESFPDAKTIQTQSGYQT